MGAMLSSRVAEANGDRAVRQVGLQQAQSPRATVGSARDARNRRGGAWAIGSFVPRLTRKVFQRHGFASATLLTDWPAIVGPELAAYTQPERLKWPHAPMKPNGASEAPSRRRGSLVLRVDGARALDVHYKGALILERINRHFGYRAVDELRIVQAPVTAQTVGSDPASQHWRATTKPAPRGLTPSPPSLPEIAAISDEGLRSALYGLQAAVLDGSQ